MVRKVRKRFCERLQKYVAFSVKNGMCMFQPKGLLCENCQFNHDFTILKTAELLASEVLANAKKKAEKTE